MPLLSLSKWTFELSARAGTLCPQACLKLRAKRTCHKEAASSQFDPERTSRRPLGILQEIFQLLEELGKARVLFQQDMVLAR
jgi:hypothetical protein